VPPQVAEPSCDDFSGIAVAEPSVYRVYNAGKPRFQLRQGEEALSVFDAEKLTPADILPSFRPGSLIATQEISTIESFGLIVVHTPGDPKLPQLLQDNHKDIRPGDGMTRNQFKAALRALEQMIGGSP
jgi:hypothetical protein